MLTKEIAETLLNYDPVTGVFKYKVSTNNRNKIGAVVGSKANGYLTFMYKGKNYRLHRIVFLLEEGVFPDKQIDHINGIRDDNRRENLRKVSHIENAKNRNSKGVCFHKGRYIAYVFHEGKQKNLGRFDSYEEAFTIAQRKKKELRGIFYRSP